MDLDLAGKSVLITGASRGIGYAAATGFAKEGCALRLVSRNSETLEKAAAELRATWGVDVQTLAMDMREPGAVEAVAKRFGAETDILLNNAGDIPHGTLMDVDADRWRKAWDLKVYGYIDLTRTIYAHMRERRRGVIVNVIGAAGGVHAIPSYIAGSTGNAALDAFTRTLGAISTDEGIRVVGVHPHMIATDRQVTRWRQRAVESLGDADRWKELTTHLPFGRLADPAEVANVLVFLASGAASYVSGTTITVDGGMSQRHSSR
jgi:NAD(P)-dependent dehydrogenase (short-subunit alcohol dehydrogenase family)